MNNLNFKILIKATNEYLEFTEDLAITKKGEILEYYGHGHWGTLYKAKEIVIQHVELS